MIRAYVETAQRSPGVYRFVTRPSDGLGRALEELCVRGAGASFGRPPVHA